MKNYKEIALLSYPCGAGAENPDCSAGPKYLQDTKLEDQLIHSNIPAKWLSDTSPQKPTGNSEKIVHHYCSLLYQQVTRAIKSNYFPVTFGGDHSMAIGTWSAVTNALNARESFGLIWIDAHMDAHTPASSASGNIHGMPLACLLGRGDSLLNKLGDNGAKLKPEHVCLIGIRSYEKEEAERLERLGAHIFFIEDVKERGLHQVTQEALKIVNRNTQGFGLTIDIDAFDPSIAPGTGTPEKNGLLREESLAALCLLNNHPQLKAVEFAEYNPTLDEGEKTRTLIIEIMSSLFKQ